MRTFEPRQWRGLVLAGLRRDLRAGGGAIGLGRQRAGRFGPLLSLLLLNFALGTIVAGAIWAGVPIFVAGVLHLSFVLFLVASSLVLDFGTTVISPDDHELLAYYPVSPLTFLAARVTTLLVYCLALAFAFSAIPLFAYFTHGGLHIARGLVAALATAGITTACALAVVLLYTTTQELVPARHVRTALTVLQLAFSFVLYGSLILLPRLMDRETLSRTLTEVTGWQWANPATWFASWVALATGDMRPRVLIASAAAALTPFIAFIAAAPRLTLEYAHRLATQPGSAAGDRTATDSRRRAASLMFRRTETRVIALLVRAQFRFDLRFRLTVLAIVPLTLVYLLAGLLDRTRGEEGDPFLVYFAAMIFAPMLKAALVRSDAYRASWIFYVTPASLTRLMLSLKNIIVGWFLLPYIVFVGVLLSLFGAVPNVWASLLLIALASHGLLVADLFIAPQLPFSMPTTPGRQVGSAMLTMILTGPAAILAVFAIKGGLLVTLGLSVLLAIGNAVLLAGLEARVRDVLEHAEAET